MRSALVLAALASAAQVHAADSQSLQDRVDALEQRLAKLESAPAKTSLSAFNPAIGAAIDFAFRNDNSKSRFLFRSAELNVEAPIDPFLKGWAVINGSQDGVAVEEATLETTVLPWNLTARAGRLFSDFGRFAHFHDHELPVIDRPRSLDTYIGGESRADGLETAVLFPTPFYLTATLGAYNKLGAENRRADNAVDRSLDQFTYLGKLATNFELGDDHSVDLGVSEAWTPKRFVVDTSIPGPPIASAGIETRKNTWRTLTGVDLTYRYIPVSGGIYKGVVWGTEVLQNNERRFDPGTLLPTDRVRSYAGYSYLWVKVGPRWRPTMLVDLTQDQDNPHRLTQSYTAALTYDLTEFQRLRLAFTEQVTNVSRVRRNGIVGIQWTGVFGHHVHGFRDR